MLIFESPRRRLALPRANSVCQRSRPRSHLNHAESTGGRPQTIRESRYCSSCARPRKILECILHNFSYSHFYDFYTIVNYNKFVLSGTMERLRLQSEVWKRLQTIKCGKQLMQCEALVKNDQSSNEISKSDLDGQALDVDNLDATGCDPNLGDFPHSVLEDIPPDFVLQKLIKVIARNQELEANLKECESKSKKLEERVKELENELKQKEVMRLSQLKLLALRNTELEKQAHDADVRDPKEPTTSDSKVEICAHDPTLAPSSS